MQVSLDISDNLAQRLESEREHLAEIIESGLRVRDWVGASFLVKEVIDFLGRGPRPQEIVAFRPSAAAVERSRELLRRNKEGRLPPAEEAELAAIRLTESDLKEIETVAELTAQTSNRTARLQNTRQLEMNSSHTRARSGSKMGIA